MTRKIDQRMTMFALLLLMLMPGVTFAQGKIRGGGVAKAKAEMLKKGELPEVAIYLAPGVDPESFAKDNGLTVKKSLPSEENGWIMGTGTPGKAKSAEKDLSKDKRVLAVYANRITQKKLHAFTPNDPYFNANTPTAGEQGQWHLINQINTGIDVRVQTPWTNDVTGQGVLLAVIDDGLDAAHEDLAPNFNAANSHDYVDGNNDPSPTESGDIDSHGTVVGGTAAARGGNGIGVSGAAPYASIAGLRVGFGTPVASSDAEFADATLYHSSGMNNAIKIKNHSYGYSYPWITVDIETDALRNSAASGTIHFYSAGNERDQGLGAEDVNKHPYQSKPHAIVVGSADSAGKFSYYSNYGANLTCVTPSGILSTDPMGTTRGYNTGGTGSFPDSNYVSGMEGTSFSTPLAAGVLALAKQAQPALNVRFAKHLLATSCDVVDPSDTTPESDGGWKTNAAGIKFNQNYGWGLMNAAKLVQNAKANQGVTPLQTATSGNIVTNLVIPDNNTQGVSSTATINATTPLEEVLVTFNLSDANVNDPDNDLYMGDIEAYLKSPAGTTSRLFKNGGMKDNTGSLLNWTVSSNAFWGENPQGTWTLYVADLQGVDVGVLNSFTLKVNMGELVASAPSAAELLEYD